MGPNVSISQASLDPCDNLSHGKAGECIDPRKDDSSLPPPACAGPQGCQERCPAGLHGSCLQGRSQLPWPACRQRCAGRPPMPAAAASCASESQVCSPVVSASICNQGWHPCQLGNLLRRRPLLYTFQDPHSKGIKTALSGSAHRAFKVVLDDEHSPGNSPSAPDQPCRSARLACCSQHASSLRGLPCCLLLPLLALMAHSRPAHMV